MTEAELNARLELAAVYRLIHHYGWDDLWFTHISAKIPGTSSFLINEFGLFFNEITAGNLVKVDIAGNVIAGGEINPAGFVIHSAIHAAKPNVGCIIHTHTVAGVAVSIDQRGLLPISQQVVDILPNLAYHDFHGVFTDANEKRELVNNLSNNTCMILRNHGLLTVGRSASESFLRMYQLEKACSIQTMTDLDHAILIDEKVLSEKRGFKLDPAWSWKHLQRLVEKNYPDYKDGANTV